MAGDGGGDGSGGQQNEAGEERALATEAKHVCDERKEDAAKAVKASVRSEALQEAREAAAKAAGFLSADKNPRGFMNSCRPGTSLNQIQRCRPCVAAYCNWKKS